MSERSAEATPPADESRFWPTIACWYNGLPKSAAGQIDAHLTDLIGDLEGAFPRRERATPIDWAKVPSAEVIRAVAAAPVIYGPWIECSITQGWTRWELFPGPSWKGSSVHVQPCYPDSLGWGVSYRNKYRNGFGTSAEAQDVGDEWLRADGCRLDGALPSSGDPKGEP